MTAEFIDKNHTSPVKPAKQQPVFIAVKAFHIWNYALFYFQRILYLCKRKNKTIEQ
jgi:hypothetical protein